MIVRTMKTKLGILALACLAAASLNAQNYSADWESIDSRPVPEWFTDAGFGIFIHWGLYSVPSYSPAPHDHPGDVYSCYAEHYWNRLLTGNQDFKSFHERVFGKDARYEDFADDFGAEMFDPQEWASIIESSGARYVVLTSKHHEGFCMWPSEYSPGWNVGETGPQRDLLGELTAAVRARGLKMGYYYSLLEWRNPLYSPETLDEYIDRHMFPQMKELVEKYRPDIIWTDGEWDYPSERLRSTEFLQWLYNESPVWETVVVNDRWGNDTRSRHGGFYTTEYDLINDVDAQSAVFVHPWEECRGIGGSFGFNRNELLEDYASSEQLIHTLVSKVARGGNLLLNIGPTADGRIPVIMQERLKDIGDWLKVNGEAIYGSRRWPDAPTPGPDPKVFFTSKDDALYVIVTDWPREPLTVKGVRRVGSIRMLGCNGRIRYRRHRDGITILPPEISAPDDIPCRYAWVYRIGL